LDPLAHLVAAAAGTDVDVAWFKETTFTGTAQFGRATFSRTAGFDEATCRSTRDTVVDVSATGWARFSDAFDGKLPTDAAGNYILAGLDVLRGLVDGIGDFVAGRQPRWRNDDSSGAVLLASSFGLNDVDLLKAMEQLAAACIVISKPERGRYWDSMLYRLAERNAQERPPGIPLDAFDELRDLAPLEHGRPAVVGPHARLPETVAAFRTLGFRKTSAREWPPLVHAKLALLGHLLRWQVDAPGDLEAVSFQPVRLWISSANFTSGSRRSIEFGYWTEDPALLRAAQDLLVKLIAESEALDTNADDWRPEMGPIEFDHEAMIEAMAEERYAQLEYEAQVEDWLARHEADEPGG
jgi:hypothetical protein